MEIKNLKTGNLIRFGGEHFKRLVKLQETTGVKYFTKKDLAGCVSANKKTITKTQQKVKKLGTNSKRKQKGGVGNADTEEFDEEFDRCPVCFEEWEDKDGNKNIIAFRIPPCGHKICTTCARRWFFHQTKESCPLCRGKVDVSVVLQLVLPEVFEAIRKNNLDPIKTYVEQGGDVNAKDEDGNTLLHSSFITFKILKFLIENKADVNAKANDGATPLHCACSYDTIRYHTRSSDSGADNYESLEIVKCLVNKGADINAKDKYGLTPLHWLCDPNPNSIKLFHSFRIAKYLVVDKGADVNAKDGTCSTPLHYTEGGDRILEMLIENKADVNAKNNNGETPLHNACSYELYGTSYGFGIVKYFVNNGADVNAKNDDGETPLHKACEQNHEYAYTIFTHLVKNGADVNAIDKNGKTPGDIALQKGHRAIVKFLVEQNLQKITKITKKTKTKTQQKDKK